MFDAAISPAPPAAPLNHTRTTRAQRPPATAAAAARLLAQADNLERHARAVLDQPRLTNTRRRAQIASSMESRAAGDVQLAQTMRNLAVALAAGDAPHLQRLRTRSQVELLSGMLRTAKIDELRQRRADVAADKDEPATEITVNFAQYPAFRGYADTLREAAAQVKTAAAHREVTLRVEAVLSALPESSDWALLPPDLGLAFASAIEGFNSDWRANGGRRVYLHFDSIVTRRKALSAIGLDDTATLRAALREFIRYRAGRPKGDRVKELERALVGNRGIGIDFFPTPPAVAADLVRRAGVTPGHRTLEPSAGNGNIAEAIRAAGVEPEVVEISHALREILEARGLQIVANDFLAYSPGPVYDRIVMNPPFSKGADMDHLRHAYSLLATGGRVVSIIGAGALFRTDSKAMAFRAWLEEVGAEVEPLPPGTFNDPTLLATTGTNASVVTIDRP